MVLSILLTYFSAEICALILSNWLFYRLYGILAEETFVIRNPRHSIASLMGHLKVYNCPFVHTVEQICSSSDKGLLLILLPLCFIAPKYPREEFTHNQVNAVF